MASSYPAPRYDRGSGGGAAATVERGATVPVVHIFPFVLNGGNGGGSVVVSPQYQGMAVLSDLEWFGNTSGASGAWKFDILVSDDGSGFSEGGAGGTRPSGVSIFDKNSIADATDTDSEMSTSWAFKGALAVTTRHFFPLRVPITKGQFFLKAYLKQPSGQTGDISGIVRVITGLFEDELPNFL